MIVYRESTRMVHPAYVLKSAVFQSHESIRRFLIHWGELEAALVDELCPAVDELFPALERLREITCLAGRLLVQRDEATVTRLRALLARLRLPDRPIRISIPEGYAYNGLFPETYAESARRFFNETHPAEVVCIGIRSIGTSLSAIVAAALEQCGCRVDTWTLRPHKLNLAPSLERALRTRAHAHFVIIDERSAPSGSTFASVAHVLSRLGVPDHRIVLLHSTEPQSGGGVDISGGRWRSIFYDNESEFPALQPEHEARKLLCVSPRCTVLKKFAGLGEYGDVKLRHATMLAENGFCPAVLGLEDGYLATEFVPGQPLSSAATDRDLLDTMARYIAFRSEAFATDSPTPLDHLARMIELNTGAAAGPPGVTRDCIVDGRMLPHEWIASSTGYLKTDAVDHGDNHFYPGPTDIAWDLAGAIVEFNLQERDREYLIDTYAHLSGDRRVRSRLPFFKTAYLAFRVGYLSMNRSAGEPERYRALLEREYSATA